MQASVYSITARKKNGELCVVRPEDFQLERRGALDAGIILERTSISLYCLDEQRRQAIFVETPPEVDLAQHAFFYQQQYEKATRVLTVSYEVLGALAEQAGDGSGELILIYSVGRCGSTLVSRALGRVAGVDSFSEPDVYSQIGGMRRSDGSRDGELIQRIGSCTRLLWKNARPRRSAAVLKFRSFTIDIADLFRAAYPQAKALFLYRNAEAWAGSAARAFQASPAAATAHMWLPVMDRYLSLHASGVPMLAIRYETLLSNPWGAVRAILEYCGLPAGEEENALEAFREDSQAGTCLARARLGGSPFTLTLQHREQLRKALRQHPRIQDADFTLPGTANICEETLQGA